jgi:hypothetical protein
VVIVQDGHYERKLDQMIVEQVQNLDDCPEKAEWLRRHKRARSLLNSQRLQQLRSAYGDSFSYIAFAAMVVIVLTSLLMLRRR